MYDSVKKIIEFFKIFFTLILIGLTVVGFGQNSFRSADGWGAGWDINDFWSGTGFGSSFGKTYQNSYGNGYRYFRLYTHWDLGASQAMHGPTGTSDVQINLSTPTNLETWGSNHGKAYYINVSGGVTNYYYVFRTKHGNGISNLPQLIVFEIQGAIRNVVDVTQSPLATSVLPGSVVTVNANTDGTLSSGQSLYLRYTTNNWSTSSIQQMSGSGTVFTAEIPAQNADTEVDYYVFTSGTGLSISHSDADWYTINGNTNNGNNYNYTVQSGSVTVVPSFPDDTEIITITFDAEGTALEGASKVYLHSGISTDDQNVTNFEYVIGNWGQDDGVGQMTGTGEDVWQIVISPGLRNAYNVSEEDDIFGLNFLFRNAAGNVKVDNNGDNYHNPVDPGDYFNITNPSNPVHYGVVGSTLNLTAEANDPPLTWALAEIDTLTGDIISSITIQSGGADFTYGIAVTSTQLKKYKLTADFSGTLKYKTFYVRGYGPVQELPRPSWTVPGINYHEDDPTKVTLVLHAPSYTRYKKGTGSISGTSTTTAKEVVYVVGDFNGWNPYESCKMNRDRDGWDGTTDADNDGDRGDYWWIELNGLVPGQEYVFQYFIDGELMLADPYTHKVSDFDDQYIPPSVYPDLIGYREEAVDRASVLQTLQEEYSWTAPEFTHPGINELNVYELLFRDFTEEGTYLAAIGKLDYLKGLGVNAIHVMPVSEFEGNSSWGYNPNFYFAPDKAYGTAEDLKKFVDECHKREILVFNDMVLNHAFFSNVMAKMYWNEDENKPANDNPWFNPDHRMVYDPNGHWGADWNHESEHTQNMVDRILDHWLQEFNFDGFRFDFTKGFGQTAPDPGDPWAGSYDQDRVDLLLRMANGMKTRNPGAVVIFEHLADFYEEKYLADQGILMWSGVGHHNDVKNFILGWPGDNTDIYNSGVYNSPAKDFTYANLMSYAESHDEQRLGYEVKSWFNWSAFAGPKTTAADSLAAIVDRLKIGLTFNLLLPGPRMLWQFQELGYDISIDFNGRTGEKPPKWNYYENSKRRELYNLVSRLLKIRDQYDIYSTIPDYGNIGLGANNITEPRVMRLSSSDGRHVIVVANLDPAAGHDVYPNFDVTGTWYKYNGNEAVDGTNFTVSNTSDPYFLNYSEMMVFTNFELDKCTEVRNSNDSGEHSLRGAIGCAQEGDVVTVEYPVFGETIVLSSPVEIDKNLTIEGFQSRNITVDGSGFTGGVLSIAEGKTVTIEGIKFICSTGNADGRCILNDGILTLDNVELLDPDNSSNASTILNTDNGTIRIENSVNITN